MFTATMAATEQQRSAVLRAVTAEFGSVLPSDRIIDEVGRVLVDLDGAITGDSIVGAATGLARQRCRQLVDHSPR